jgi:RimJ/RimL family protein N-acetyltransferase
MQAQSITTERLLLRRHTADDLAALAAVWADPDVMRHVGGRISSLEDSWARVLRYAGHWSLCGYGFWAVVEAATGRYIGDVGFADFKRACEPALSDAPEGGWVLAQSAHGRGFATEALRAALAWDEHRLARQRTRCIIDPGNDASVRVAAKCGFARVGDALYRGEPICVYERPADAG